MIPRLFIEDKWKNDFLNFSGSNSFFDPKDRYVESPLLPEKFREYINY